MTTIMVGLIQLALSANSGLDIQYIDPETRKPGQLDLLITDPAGTPVPGATVIVDKWVDPLLGTARWEYVTHGPTSGDPGKEGTCHFTGFSRKAHGDRFRVTARKAGKGQGQVELHWALLPTRIKLQPGGVAHAPNVWAQPRSTAPVMCATPCRPNETYTPYPCSAYTPCYPAVTSYCYPAPAYYCPPQPTTYYYCPPW